MRAFEPTSYDKDSLILILGSFPSKRSRESNFYYQHPSNRFWKILESLFNASLCKSPDSEANIKTQKAFLKDQKIVLWDTISSCDAPNSNDNDLKDIQINERIFEILEATSIQAIFLNGSKAKESFCKLCKKQQKELSLIENAGKKHFKLSIQHRIIEVYPLPSTSPANAKHSLESLIQDWQIIKRYTP